MNVGDLQVVFSASVTSITASITSLVILYPNRDRKAAYFFNHSNNTFFLKLGNGASTSDFTVKITSGSLYELPYPCYRDAVTAIADNTGGSLKVTECF